MISAPSVTQQPPMIWPGLKIDSKLTACLLNHQHIQHAYSPFTSGRGETHFDIMTMTIFYLTIIYKFTIVYKPEYELGLVWRLLLRQINLSLS